MRNNPIEGVNIDLIQSVLESEKLDELLWQVLWKPLGLPRHIRRTFSIQGESFELIAKARDRILGGLVGVWTASDEIELRHLAVSPEAQNQGIGRQLIEDLIRRVREQGCRRIHTIARNTSCEFFQKAGFSAAPGIPPEHPVFLDHGIRFELMEMRIESTVKDCELNHD